jgi:phosphatidylserine/phosphatidylglycerophosphate/cardiolipin synthase-like enzyme
MLAAAEGEGMTMTWLLLATGFTGALTAVFLLRAGVRRLGLAPNVAVYHSPKGGCTDAVVREINHARREILVQAYSFTSKPIADALVKAKARGVRVEIILDRSNEHETYTELGEFMEKGLTPVIDAQHAIAHNKVIVIDGRTLITGSFNFTHQAEVENAENLIVLRGHSGVLEAYRKDFAAHKAHCQAPKVKPAAPAHAKKAA